MGTRNRFGLALVLIAFFVLDIARNNQLVEGTILASLAVIAASIMFMIGIFMLVGRED